MKYKPGFYKFKRPEIQAIVQVLEVIDYLDELAPDKRDRKNLAAIMGYNGPLEVRFKAITHRDIDLFYPRDRPILRKFKVDTYLMDVTEEGFTEYFEWLEDQEIIALLYGTSKKQDNKV